MDENNKPTTGGPKCYKFKMNGWPFCMGTKESSISVRRLATSVLHDLYNIGWKVSIL